jgi:hypothetical protein
MRIRSKAFFSCAVLAGVMLAAAGATAADPPPAFCPIGDWTIVASGPTSVPCSAPEGTCTEVVYTIANLQLQGATDHVATLLRVEAAQSPVEPPASSFLPACEGDNVTGLGKYSCHERVVRLNRRDTTDQFALVVGGNRAPITTSVLVKKGKFVGSCEIVGIGFEGPNPFQAANKVETVNFKGCAVDFHFDVLTGAVTNVELNETASTKPVCTSGPPYPPGSSCCSQVIATDVQNLTLELNVPGVGPLGLGQFGEGYISSGTASCTTRVIGGRVYTWGSPCPQ